MNFISAPSAAQAPKRPFNKDEKWQLEYYRIKASINQRRTSF
jgi:hypothetical protein